jgi:hypothetical protein
MYILVVDQGMSEDTIVLGFINSSGEEAGITEYQYYPLKEVE